MNTLKLKCKVVLLPTKEASCLMIDKNDFSDTFGKILYSKNFGFDVFNHNNNFEHINKQHLYLVSEEAINSGEYMFDDDPETGLESIRVNVSSNTYLGGGHYKVKATTNPSLNLPPISQSFIEKYVDMQGKINTVDIELEYDSTLFDDVMGCTGNPYKIKTNPDGSCIVLTNG
jgi:hypothetical protein